MAQQVHKNSMQMFLVRSLIFLGFFLLLCPAAYSSSPPNAPKQKYWVTDQAGILSTNVKQQLTDDAVAHEKNTGDQVVIVTVRSLDGWPIEEYSLWLANNWRIGQKSKNNGVLLLVAPNERKVRIEVGIGLESVITDSLAKSIINNEIFPAFKNGMLQEGVVAGHRALLQALGGKYIDKSWYDKLISLICLPFFLLLGGRRFSGGGGSFGGGGASGSW